jgi:hypothetical protein
MRRRRVTPFCGIALTVRFCCFWDSTTTVKRNSKRRGNPVNEHVKHWLDSASIAAALAAWAAWLPPAAAFVSLIWTLIRIYETRTVQGWLRAWRSK